MDWVSVNGQLCHRRVGHYDRKRYVESCFNNWTTGSDMKKSTTFQSIRSRKGKTGNFRQEAWMGFTITSVTHRTLNNASLSGVTIK